MHDSSQIQNNDDGQIQIKQLYSLLTTAVLPRVGRRLLT
jgi:hypothetical protein